MNLFDRLLCVVGSQGKEQIIFYSFMLWIENMVGKEYWRMTPRCVGIDYSVDVREAVVTGLETGGHWVIGSDSSDSASMETDLDPRNVHPL